MTRRAFSALDGMARHLYVIFEVYASLDRLILYPTDQQWDLNTGQIVRNFTAHGAQLAGVAVRPESSSYSETGPPVVARSTEGETSIPSTQTTLQDQPIASGTAFGSSEATLQGSSETQLPTSDPQTAQDSDTKSDASFDPLFDDEPDNSEAPGSVAKEQEPSPASNFAMPNSVPPPPLPSQPPLRPAVAPIPPPKGAPPLLDPISYATYSSDLLMTASIDGQVILWDRRAHTPGQGVGRLWMSEKTPPWCLSVCILLLTEIVRFLMRAVRPVGPPMEASSLQEDVMERSMFGMYASWDGQALAIRRGS